MQHVLIPLQHRRLGRKRRKCEALNSDYIFEPLGVKSMGRGY